MNLKEKQKLYCKIKPVYNSLLIVTYFLFHVRQQSTPIGSMQTGQDVVVSPNRDKHATANKVKTSFFSKMFKCWWKKMEEMYMCKSGQK